jgi:acylglycerol lipase
VFVAVAPLLRLHRAGSKDKTLNLYEGAFHDLLNDVDKATVMADINRWIEERLPTL